MSTYKNSQTREQRPRAMTRYREQVVARRSMVPAIARLRGLLAEAATALESAADRLSDVGHNNTASAMRTDASRIRREGGA